MGDRAGTADRTSIGDRAGGLALGFSGLGFNSTLASQSLQSLTQSTSLPYPQRSIVARRTSTQTSGGDVVRLGLNQPSSQSYLRDEQVQDRLFGVIVDAMTSLFHLGCLDELANDVLSSYEVLLEEHHRNPYNSRLKALVPTMKRFFTPLPFAKAFSIYNDKYRVTKRKFIPPTFHEVRHIMNIAQVMACAEHLKLISFDGDETLYQDGKNFTDIDIATSITTFLKRGIHVAVVTAAGYGYQIEKYETRLKKLLQFWEDVKLSPSATTRFFVFGGESNYLLRCGTDYRLHPVSEADWRPHMSENLRLIHAQTGSDSGMGADVHRLLDIAEKALEIACEELNIRGVVTRKERAVGLVPGGAAGKLRCPTGAGMKCIRPEILEEVFFRVHQSIRNADPPVSVPFCAFNGGHDVWVDVGNKAEGVRILQSFLNIEPEESLHVGDQFSVSGNDIAARDVAPTLWVCNPTETKAVLRSFLRFIKSLEENRMFAQTDSDQSDDEKTGRNAETRRSDSDAFFFFGSTALAAAEAATDSTPTNTLTSSP